MKELKREIEVVENLISILNRFFAIQIKEKDFERAKNTKIDLEICKKELIKLVSERKAELDGEKEPIGDAVQNGSGTSIS